MQDVLLDSKLTIYYNYVRPRLSSPECLHVRPRYSPYSFIRLLRNHGLRSDQLHMVARAILLHASCMPPRHGGDFRARGTASAWNGWWPDCGVYGLPQGIF